MELAAHLEALAWYEASRGRSCCAQLAWHAAQELRGWVAEPEKMGSKKESSLG